MHSLLPFLTVSLSFVFVKAQYYYGFPPDVGCPPEEAFWHNGYYYQFFDCPMTWNDAEQTCRSRMVVDGETVLGGHLISIFNRVERDWLQFQILQRYGRHVGIWIGLKRSPRNRASCPIPQRWTDGNRVLYRNFDLTEPDCRWDHQDCFHMTRNQTWNDAECSSSMRFVCKIPAPPDSGPNHPRVDVPPEIVPDDFVTVTDNPFEISSTAESTEPTDQEASTTPINVSPKEPIRTDAPETPKQDESSTQPDEPPPPRDTPETPRTENPTEGTKPPPPDVVEPAKPEVPSGDLPPPPPGAIE